MAALPPFPVTVVGSWPRPPKLLQAQRLKQMGQFDPAEFDCLADEAVLEAVRAQEAAGIDVITDGEQRRDNFFSFVAEKLDGVALMSLAEMVKVVEDQAGFERILESLDVPAYSISNAVCTGSVRRRRPLALDEFLFLKQYTRKPVKVTLPGPYLLTRAMYIPRLSGDAYPAKEDLGEDVVRVLRAELSDLAQAGVDFVQFDEPVLTELVFTQGQTRTFMCAALAARKDPAEELEWAVALLNRVVAGFEGVRIGLHICRGNWSQNEATLLRGSYYPLAGYLDRMRVQQLVLEYATERAGDLLAFAGKEIGLGVVNPRTALLETPAAIVQSVRRALEMYPAGTVWLNPDCGFSTFSARPVSNVAIARSKLEAMVAAARLLRDAL